MKSDWHIDDYLKKVDGTIEDVLNVIGIQCVSWASQNLRRGYSKANDVRSSNLINGLVYSTPKVQSSPTGQTSGTQLEPAPKNSVHIGTSNIVYAAQHEFGGRISAHNAGALTIPISEEAKRAIGGARSFPNLVLIKPRGSDNAFLVEMTGENTFKIMYLLTKSVEQPAYPYLRPVVNQHKSEILQIIKAAFNG
jgi:phage gpG-like protein